MQISAINTSKNQPNFSAKIVSIRNKDSLNMEKLKALTYVVRNRRGYKNDLYQMTDNNTVQSLETVGFINTGHTLKSETYSVTNLGDQYYKDIFGITSYYLQRIAGFANKIFK